MTNNVYTLYNRLSSRYGDVFAFPTDAFAVRTLMADGSVIQKHPDDYELWFMGTSDIENGTIEILPRKLIPWNVSTPVETEAK